MWPFKNTRPSAQAQKKKQIAGNASERIAPVLDTFGPRRTMIAVIMRLAKVTQNRPIPPQVAAYTYAFGVIDGHFDHDPDVGDVDELKSWILPTPEQVADAKYGDDVANAVEDILFLRPMAEDELAGGTRSFLYR